MNSILLPGCRPEPLAGYLKGLAILRLVSEQADDAATGCWTDGVFRLQTHLNERELLNFFLNAYRPTPVITPWNGGSGFWDGDNKRGIAAIQCSTSPRFSAYVAAIRETEECIQSRRMTQQPDATQKSPFVQALRARLSDEALAWLDAALVLTHEGISFPPLLGTGGNDGRLDFANNFMQRLAEQIIQPSGSAQILLSSAILGGPSVGLTDAAIGQFFPLAAGGANAGPGFEGAAGTNPWDFILLIEGAICFGAATVRRLESGLTGAAVVPFTVRASASGFGSAAPGEIDTARNELWLPLWNTAATWQEVSAVFREGRIRVGRRAGATATDFARALASLGTDRGISCFARYAFHQRNGRSFQAVPLGRWPVATAPTGIAQRLDVIDHWLASTARMVGDKIPAALSRAIRRLDDAILASLRPSAGPAGAQAVLLALANVESAAADSKDHAGLRNPVPALSAEDWLPVIADQTAEFDLAASLAPGLRERWSNVRRTGDRWLWRDASMRPPPSARVWRRGSIELRLLDLLDRERVERSTGVRARRHDADAAWCAHRDSVQTFLDGNTDDGRIVELARGLSLLTWGRCARPSRPHRPTTTTFAAARIVATGQLADVDIPDISGWIAAARREDGRQFTAATWRRLAASGIAVRGVGRRNRSSLLRDGDATRVRRLAAACRFPLSTRDLEDLLAQLSPDSITHSLQETT